MNIHSYRNILKTFIASGILVVSGLLVNIGGAAAQTTNESWQAAYWNNTTLAGEPSVTRTEAAVNYTWGDGSPVPGIIGADRFSARWTGSLNLPAGRYRFTVAVDDGARLWVDNQLLIDEWTVQSRQVYQADITLDGSATPVRLDYFENTGEAEVQLTWQQLAAAPTPAATPAPTPAAPAVGAPINVWIGEYYNNLFLSGAPALVRSDEQLSFNWGTGSPAPGVIEPERFSVRWTRTLGLNPGRYQFAATADDGVRLWIDSQLVIDDWVVQSARTLLADVTVAGGAVPVQMEYFENTDEAVAQLTWTQLGATGVAPLPPDAITATIARANFLNMRSGPGVAFGRVSVLPRGQVVELLGRNGNATWTLVRLPNGNVGWVNSFYLDSSIPIGALPVTN
jgi:hypothetical protein